MEFKKFIAILSAILFVVFLGWNVWYFRQDPISFIGAVVFLLLLGIAWVAALFNGVGGFGANLTIALFIVVLIGSGGIFVIETLGQTTPLATINIDNSTNTYPMPENPNLSQKETIEWMEKKIRVNWVDMFKITILGKLVTTSALWLEMVIALLSMAIFDFLSKKIPWWPEKLKNISIPIEFLILSAMVSSIILTMPNFDKLDPTSQYGLRISWIIGFTQDWWYLGAISLISKGIEKAEDNFNRADEKYEDTGKGVFKFLSNLGFVFSGLTFMWHEILTLTINPIHVAWKVCGDLLLSTPITNTSCMQANQHGGLFFLFASATYVWILIRGRRVVRKIINWLKN